MKKKVVEVLEIVLLLADGVKASDLFLKYKFGSREVVLAKDIIRKIELETFKY